MPYPADNGYPAERASKLGQTGMIGDAHIRSLLEGFESADSGEGPPVERTAAVDLSHEHGIQHVVAVDGGQGLVPCEVRSRQSLAFVQIAAVEIEVEHIRHMRAHPLMDPRDVRGMLGGNARYVPAVLPLCGVRWPGLTVRDTIRCVVDATLAEAGLYDTLRFLIWHEWEPGWQPSQRERPRMRCVECREQFDLPPRELSFACPHCSHEHTLADYLDICGHASEDRSREEAAWALRDLLETLVLFHYVWIHRDDSRMMQETLFVKDGPLLLRAALERLVPPIRAFVGHLRDAGTPPRLVGVEKTGDFVQFAGELGERLPEPGDYFLPGVRYIFEEVLGVAMPKNYVSRQNYGSKLVARLGEHHMVALNILTGAYVREPLPENLIGFEGAIGALSELVSYRHENALIPLVLAHEQASIARSPSGDILSTFVARSTESPRTRT